MDVECDRGRVDERTSVSGEKLAKLPLGRRAWRAVEGAY